MNPESQYADILTNVFKHARVCNPDYVRRLVSSNRFTADLIKPILQSLVEKHLIMPGDTKHNHKPCINSLLKEMGSFAEACSLENYSKLDHMKKKSERLEQFYMNLPNRSAMHSWYLLYAVVALLQSHSCAAERGFSKLKIAMKNKQCLEDGVEASLMMMFNKDRNIAMDLGIDEDGDSIHSDDDGDHYEGISGGESENDCSDHGNDIGNYCFRNDAEVSVIDKDYDNNDENSPHYSNEHSFDSADDRIIHDITDSIEKLKLPETNGVLSGEKSVVTVQLFRDVPDTIDKNTSFSCTHCKRFCTTQFDKKSHETFCPSDPNRKTAEKGIKCRIEPYMQLCMIMHVLLYQNSINKD